LRQRLRLRAHLLRSEVLQTALLPSQPLLQYLRLRHELWLRRPDLRRPGAELRLRAGLRLRSRLPPQVLPPEVLQAEVLPSPLRWLQHVRLRSELRPGLRLRCIACKGNLERAAAAHSTAASADRVKIDLQGPRQTPGALLLFSRGGSTAAISSVLLEIVAPRQA
jgi:hypothetical protein